jgi:hypothetical protein
MQKFIDKMMKPEVVLVVISIHLPFIPLTVGGPEVGVLGLAIGATSLVTYILESPDSAKNLTNFLNHSKPS